MPQRQDKPHAWYRNVEAAMAWFITSKKSIITGNGNKRREGDTSFSNENTKDIMKREKSKLHMLGECTFSGF